MNERFKFRVWDNKYNCYDYLRSKSALRYQFDEFRMSSGWDGEDHPTFSENVNDGYIIEQCTGLRDKNGTLIYENDKIVHSNKFILSNGKPEEKVGFIKFDKKLARFVITGEYLNSDMNAEHCVYQIIGNIHTDKGE
jgi:uncharacterized phage protein (TIGR01671 family)